MDRIGFGNRLLSWIKWCVSTTSFLVLFSSSHVGFFQSSRGLRQGDPISPYLFVIGMEALGMLVQRAVEGNFLYGSRVTIRGGEGRGRSFPIYFTQMTPFYSTNPTKIK